MPIQSPRAGSAKLGPQLDCRLASELSTSEGSMSAASIPEKSVVDKWERARLRHTHHHEPVINVNLVHETSMTFGERASDAFAVTMGSWKFIIIQSVILAIWVALN